MRMIVALFVSVILLSNSASAQSGIYGSDVSPKMIEFAKKNILFGLTSGNDGVIQSLMMLAAKIVMVEPRTDLSQIRTTLMQFTSDHPSNSIRFKAFIVMNILDDPKWFTVDEMLHTSEPEQFFSVAATRMQLKLLAADPA